MTIRIAFLLVLISGIAFAESKPVIQDHNGDGCTLAIVRASRTADGRMLIWKNRDVSNRNQVVRLMQGSPYRFVGIGYGDDTTQVWGGVNTAGFGIANSNSWNSQSFQTPDDDGTIQTLALGTCNTLAQFRTILNQTNSTPHTPQNGRNTPSCFLAFDSSGTMSVFEANRSTWTEFPLTASDPNGFMTRANYAYSRDTLHNPLGYYRNARARRFYANTLAAGPLPLDTVFRVMRDVAPDGWTPDAFPLPYDGTFSSYPYAYISMQGSICRYITTSAMVIQGGKRLPNGTWLPPLVWFLLGEPVATIAVPAWPHQSHLSSLLTGSSAPICSESGAIFGAIDSTNYCLDSRPLVNSHGGLLPYIYSQEALARARVMPYLSQALDSTLAASVSDSIATFAYTALNTFAPPAQPVNITYSLDEGAFSWAPVTTDFRGRSLPNNITVTYDIERATPTHAPCSLQFSLVESVTTNRYVIKDPPLNFVYRIKAVTQ